MLVNEEDKNLANKISSGDTEAENYLFTRFKEKIQFLVRIRLKKKIPTEDQEDIVSEIMKAVMLSLRRGSFNAELGKPLEAYIAGIASNIVGQYFRKVKKLKEEIDIDLVKNIPNNENSLSELVREERNNKLQGYLQKLKPKYKEVLLLRIYENKSIDEISNILNIEKRRVSERINYAFKLFLKECKRDNYFQYYDD